MAKKQTRSKSEMRNLRIQQLIFVAFGVIVILSMIISMIVK